jgi:hypothetical protein
MMPAAVFAEFRTCPMEFASLSEFTAIPMKISVSTDPHANLFGAADRGCRNRKGCDGR